LFDIDDEGLETEDRWRVGIGIMERLGGRGGCTEDPLDAENAGENERCIAVVLRTSSSHPSSDIGGAMERNLLLGAGI